MRRAEFASQDRAAIRTVFGSFVRAQRANGHRQPDMNVLMPIGRKRSDQSPGTTARALHERLGASIGGIRLPGSVAEVIADGVSAGLNRPRSTTLGQLQR